MDYFSTYDIVLISFVLLWTWLIDYTAKKERLETIRKMRMNSVKIRKRKFHWTIEEN